MTCRTCSDCVRPTSLPKSTSGCRRSGGRIVPLVAALLIHAVAILSVLGRSSVDQPSRDTLAVSLLMEQHNGRQHGESGQPLKAAPTDIAPTRAAKSFPHSNMASAAPEHASLITRPPEKTGTAPQERTETSHGSVGGKSTSTPIGESYAGGGGPDGSSARTSVSIPARYAASNRKPAYPLLSRRNEEQGTVVLRVLVQADGSASKVQVKQSSGYPLLDESARSAVENWHFQPASRNNVAVAEWYQVAVPFTLYN